MKLVSLDSKRGRNRGPGGDRLGLVGVHGDQDLLVDKEASTRTQANASGHPVGAADRS